MIFKIPGKIYTINNHRQINDLILKVNLFSCLFSLCVWARDYLVWCVCERGLCDRVEEWFRWSGGGGGALGRIWLKELKTQS